MDVTGKFPIYEADQVLSAEHLNQSLAYLEKHDRLSRRLLHGVGIVCGLTFKVEKDVLHIAKGCGITSEGYLIALEKALELTQVRKYIPPYPPKYSPFYQANDKPFALWEAVPTIEAEGEELKKLSDFNLKDKVLLLYLEMRDKDLKECIGDDCDNNGTVREFTLRPLIIGVTDLVKIFNQDGNTIEDIASNELARYMLNEIAPPRFDVVATNISSTVEINEAYMAMADSLLPELALGLQQTEMLYGDALNMPKTMADGLEKLKNKLANVRKQPLGQQYFYAHLCDVAAAYNEFAEVATRWMVAFMPDENDFPRHLALGEFSEIKENYPKIFRNYFKHAPTAPEAHRQQKHVAFLYSRLLKVLYNFELESEKQIRITPSTYGKPLSEKAIPYYYRPTNSTDQSWLLGWNFNYRERGIWNRTGHYFNNPQNLLQRDLENYNLFRIEGQLGKPYTEALAEVKKQINNYRIPVKAIALSTGTVPLDLNLLDECRITDLDAQFETARQNLLCQLQEVSCYFASLPQMPMLASIKKEEESASAFAGTNTAKVEADKKDETNFTLKADYTDVSGIRTAGNRMTFVTGKTANTFAKGQFLATNCSIKKNTIGSAYLELIQLPGFKDKNLLDIYLPYLNIGQHNAAARQIYLLYTFPYFVLDEIEELVGIMRSSTLSTLNFRLLKTFAEEFIAFVKLYVNEINRLENEEEFTTSPTLHDVKHQLIHLIGLCKLKTFFGLYTTYRQRIKTALDELRFENFVAKHPGIDHKGGTKAGGTYILVYHTSIKEDENLEIESKETPNIAFVDSGILFEEMKRANPMAKTSVKEKAGSTAKMKTSEANVWMKDNLTEYAKATGKRVTPEVLKKLEEMLGGFNAKDVAESELDEGTVFADFYLPYICCSDCGGIEINLTEPQAPLSVSLPSPKYCLGSKEVAEFLVSPAGGIVTGPGVEEKDGKFFFNPSSRALTIGQQNFIYTLDGRTAQTKATVIALPDADFKFEISTTPNGSFVQFANLSTNAEKFEWDFGNGETSKDETPKSQFYPLKTEEITVTLRAGNGFCEDVEPKTITLLRKAYQLSIGKEQTEFCSDMSEVVIDIFIKDVGRESFPFDGIVKGLGVKAPDGGKRMEWTFNPSEAGVGKQKLLYVVGGVEVASLEINVLKSFTALFDVKLSNTNDGLSVGIININPKDKKTYNWRFDEQKPMDIETRTNDSDFTHFYTAKEIEGRKKITIDLQVNDSPCTANFSLTFDVPARESTAPVVVLDPKLNVGVFDASTVVVPIITVGNDRTIKTSGMDQATTDGKKLLGDIAAALKNASTKKKLVGGSMNAEIGKSFIDVLTEIQKFVSANRRALSATELAEAMTFYGRIAVGMINFIGLLEADLKLNEALAKNFTSAGNSFVAMKALSMPSDVKTNIKTRLTTLAGLNKPIAAAMAKSINSAL